MSPVGTGEIVNSLGDILNSLVKTVIITDLATFVTVLETPLRLFVKRRMSPVQTGDILNSRKNFNKLLTISPRLLNVAKTV